MGATMIKRSFNKAPTARVRLRQVARRGVLLGLESAYRLSGATKRAAAAPGATLLLIHNTPPRSLARLLAFVDARSSRITDFATALKDSTAQTPDRPLIALTFDDGFRSNLDAAEALARRGISACFYVPTGVVGATSQHDVDSFFGRPQAEGVMTWSDLEHVLDLGHVVGSHCLHHRPMVNAGSSAAAEDELKASVGKLRERLGVCEHFAWPFGGLKHAPVDDVVRWSSEIDVTAASGVRGLNTDRSFSRLGYLLRDAVDLRWIGTDFDVFSTRRYLTEPR